MSRIPFIVTDIKGESDETIRLANEVLQSLDAGTVRNVFDGLYAMPCAECGGTGNTLPCLECDKPVCDKCGVGIRFCKVHGHMEASELQISLVLPEMN